MYNNLGNVYFDLKDYIEAEDAYRQAIAKDPNDAAAYSNLGILLRLNGRIEDVLPLLEKMIEINPEDFNPYLAIASINKQLEKVMPTECMDKARQFMPDDDWYNRACLESVAGNIDKAFDYLKEAAQLEKFDPGWARQDPDLQWLGDDPRFKGLVSE